jgi:hypothetical protein
MGSVYTALHLQLVLGGNTTKDGIGGRGRETQAKKEGRGSPMAVAVGGWLEKPPMHTSQNGSQLQWSYFH